MSQQASAPVPKISVVVPFYNVEAFIAECLESLAGQTLRDLEVIMVDDGSTDGSLIVARRFADRDPRFRLVRQDNQGLGPARNTGVGHATGTYLTFVDSDDVVPPKAYAQMVGSLEATGSDFATGNVMRFDDDRRWQSGMYGKLFERDHKKTHITRERELIRDRIVCNKIFRRSFWDAQGFEFPGEFYEDTPVVFPAHVNASSVDVIKDYVYEWRVRPGSITQNRFELDNLKARLGMVEFVRDYAAKRAPELVPAWDAYVLENDFVALVGAIAEAAEADRERVLELAVREVDVVAPEAIKLQKAHRRLMVHLIRHRMVPELLEVNALTPVQLSGVRAVRRGRLRRRWYGQYPFFEDPSKNIPLDRYDVTDEIKVLGRVISAHWKDGRLQIEGHSRLPFLEMASPTSAKLTIWLRNTKTGAKVTLPVTRVERPDVTADSTQDALCYHAAGWSVAVDPERLGGVPGNWELHAEIGYAGLKRSDRVMNPWLGRHLWPAGRMVGSDLHLMPVAGVNGRFLVRVHRPQAMITGSAVVAGELVVEGWVRGRPTGVSAVVSDGTAEVSGPVETAAAAGGRSSFRGRLPLAGLVRGTRRPVDLADWEVTLTGAGTPIKLFPAEGLPEKRYALDGQEIALTRTRYGGLRIVERVCRPVVTGVAWTAEGRLALTGDQAGHGDRPEQLVLRHRVTGEEQTADLAWAGSGFTAVITVGAFDLFGTPLPLGSGNWHLLARGAGEDVSVVVERTYIPELPSWHTSGLHEYLLSVTRMDSLELRVRPALSDAERGPYAQRRLREEVYPVQRRRPVRDLVVMDSFDSRQYSDSPRALTEELLRRGTGHEIVWISADGQFRVPEGCRVVLRNSVEHHEVMAQARLVVANNPMPPGYVRRDGQTYLQTWHGTPLKRIGFDIAKWHGAADYLDRFAADVAQWDYLVSPQPFSTPIFQRAFRYDGEILESGYPRNDLLSSPDAAVVADAVRKRLGIPAGKRVVLYAPTWRDDQRKTGGVGLDLNLDLAEFERTLGDDHVLLVRGHINVREAVGGIRSRQVLDVSKYPDIVELYVAADVLITDYSSVMFDFAVTRKPMLFFTYDLEHYRDKLRGFYFDFEAEAPGPLLRTNDEVFAALTSLDPVAAAHAPAYTAFVERFCPLDDGKASARVLDRVLD